MVKAVLKTFTNQAVVYPLLSQSDNGENYAAVKRESEGSCRKGRKC